MKYFIYECFDCKHQDISRQDGIGCRVCGGRAIPLRDATDFEVQEYRDKVKKLKSREITIDIKSQGMDEISKQLDGILQKLKQIIELQETVKRNAQGYPRGV